MWWTWRAATPRCSSRRPGSRCSSIPGNGGAGAVRDAERILSAARDAGITQIDHLITTHYHGDHIGGLAELAARIPIRHFIDHGPSVQPNANIDAFLQKAYPELYSKVKHTVVKPGDRVPVAGLDVRVVTSAGEAIKAPLPGAGRPNPYCASFKPHVVNPVSGQPVGNTEDEQSVGSHITFGKFRALYLGDLTWNKEFDLDVSDESDRDRGPVRAVTSWASRARIQRRWCMPSGPGSRS